MAPPKRLVLCVEGEGDVAAAPLLVKRLLTELQAWDCVWLDPNPLRMGGVTSLFGRKAENWSKKLELAAERGGLGAVLLLQDGDVGAIPGQLFCPASLGRDLSQRARNVGAGKLFSVASVFARQEFESWLIAGVGSLAGKPLPDGRPGIPAGVAAPAGDLEQNPRDAKKWLKQRLPTGYAETTDQALLTQIVEIKAIRQRGMRSFRRLENALNQLVNAVRTGQHIVTPAPPG